MNAVTDDQLEKLVDVTNIYFLGQNKDLRDIRSEFESVVGFSNLQLTIHEIVKIPTDKKFVGQFFGLGDSLEETKQSEKGGSDPLDINRYLNVWICNIQTIDERINTLLGGYATPPEGMPGWPETGHIQGILIDDLIAIQNSKMKVLAHEIGHYLGLRHIVEISMLIAKIMMEYWIPQDAKFLLIVIIKIPVQMYCQI